MLRLNICCFSENLAVDYFTSLHSDDKFLNNQQILGLSMYMMSQPFQIISAIFYVTDKLEIYKLQRLKEEKI